VVLPCTAVRTPLALFAFALVVRLILIALFPDAAYPDSYYYVDVARSLAAGRGFEVDFVWIFVEVGGKIPAYPTLPVPSNAHWMPLASIVQVPFIWLLGNTAIASALPFALLGAVTAPLAWAMARDVGATERVAVGTGILVAIPLFATPFMAQPDNFALYQPLVMGAIWAAGRGLRGHPRSYALAGALVGLATLSRSDGILVGVAVGLLFVGDRWLAWRSGGSRPPRIPLWAAVACAGLFVAVVAPWFARQLIVFGAMSPSTATGKVLLIRDFSEWNSITTPASWEHFLGQGLGPLLASRVGGLVAAVSIFSVLVGGVVLVPLMAIGGWARRRSPDFAPWFLYAFLLFAANALVFAVHVPGGTFIHSAIGLAPQAFVLALEGVALAVAWIARRRPAWNVESATRFFIVAVIGFAVVAAIGATMTTHAAWRVRTDEHRFAAGALDAAGATTTDRVMSIDASGTFYWSGRGGVVLVDDPLATIEEVARAYDIRWLIIQRSDGVPAVAPIINGTSSPAWVGPPVATWPEAPDGGPMAGPVDVGVYPVCLDAGDARCAQAGP
jgi:hypothetical protein